MLVIPRLAAVALEESPRNLIYTSHSPGGLHETAGELGGSSCIILKIPIWVLISWSTKLPEQNMGTVLMSPKVRSTCLEWSSYLNFFIIYIYTYIYIALFDVDHYVRALAVRLDSLYA